MMPEQPLEMSSIPDSADDDLAAFEHMLSAELQRATGTALHKLTERLLQDNRGGGQRVLRLISELAKAGMETTRVFRQPYDPDDGDDFGYEDVNDNIGGNYRQRARRAPLPLPERMETTLANAFGTMTGQSEEQRVINLLSGLSGAATLPLRRAYVQERLTALIGEERAVALVDEACGIIAPVPTAVDDQPTPRRGQLVPAEISRQLDEATIPAHLRPA